jgi:hypothetical protein
MSDKKIVDDYYSQINSNESEVKKDPVKKPLLATKKKIVVRKAADIKIEAEKANEKRLSDLNKILKR